MGRPRELANAALFLSNPAANLITGPNLKVVDGALTRSCSYSAGCGTACQPKA